jgi:hypothetical protein
MLKVHLLWKEISPTMSLDNLLFYLKEQMLREVVPMEQAQVI